MYLLAARKHVYFSHSAYLPPLRARSALRGARGAVAMAFQTCFSQLLLTWHFKLASHTRRVLSPELQECMDRTKGALLRAHRRMHRRRRSKPQNPQRFGLRAGGELAQQSGVNHQQKAAARSPSPRENHGGRRRRPVIAHSHTARSAHSAQAHSKQNPPTTPTATWRTSHQYSTEPGGQDSSQNRSDDLRDPQSRRLSR